MNNMASARSEYELPLPIALVSAFVEAGRPVMPTDRSGAPRTEEVRDTLTRMMVDANFYFAYSARLHEAFGAYDLDVPFDESVLPLPDYDDTEIAANGFVIASGPDTLAAWALDPSAFEGINQLLFDEIPAGKAGRKEIGPWLRQAQERWPVGPYEPPQWLRDKIAAAGSSPSFPTPFGDS